MTISYECTQAVLPTRDLLKRLSAGELIEAEILRHHAQALLKHFPQSGDIDLLTTAIPSIWASPDARWLE